MKKLMSLKMKKNKKILKNQKMKKKKKLNKLILIQKKSKICRKTGNENENREYFIPSYINYL